MDVELSRRVEFTVDAALLRELGERLVGRPHIALAELVKNSYDADATEVVVIFEADTIEVVDNGHGMTEQEFRDYWMRVGSPHKERQMVSRRLNRPLTGSKGVGRLAVQFLGDQLRMITVSDEGDRNALVAEVDWTQAREAADLTKAEARYGLTNSDETFPRESKSGTRLTLHKLSHRWTPAEFRQLAEELWMLQPPFAAEERGSRGGFLVRLESPNSHVVKQFEEQIRAIRDIWHARLKGRLVVPPGKDDSPYVRLEVTFAGSSPRVVNVPVPDCQLHDVVFDIRVFHLVRKQPRGIKVDDARSYLARYGGVNVYDAGFRLPYYGVETDWLRIEMDHSHRLSKSQLLPSPLQFQNGLSFLPTNSRLLGEVHVNTSRERQLAGDDAHDVLQIQVTRDRLVDNQAYRQLVYVLRWAIDYYAMEEARRSFQEIGPAPRDQTPDGPADRIERALEANRNAIPQEVVRTVRREVQTLVNLSRRESERLARHAGVLGALATAGMSALAYEHEVRKQYHLLNRVQEALAHSASLSGDKLRELAGNLDEFMGRAERIRGLFAPLLDEENRETIDRFRARGLVDAVLEQAEPFLERVQTRTSGIPDSLTFPRGRFVEWSAILQNVFVNAANAMLDREVRILAVSSRDEPRGRRALLVSDTGVGVDVPSSAELFEPFVRRVDLDARRRALGLGGTGLGLTIVRMIAENLGCRVRFIEPEEGFRTSFHLSWKEDEG